MISEKEMENQIAAHPERFLGERRLSLVSRQLRIGSYIFDLLFEDRHAGKLIVEIQRGTLDREHTYKILDYYDEYRERNPGEFIDVMVVANQISAERKKRLHALGIEFRELPEQLFTAVPPEGDTPKGSINQRQVQEDVPLKANRERSMTKMSSKRNHFRSLGPSAFVEAARNALAEKCEADHWKLGGESSLTAEFVPATSAIERVGGVGLTAQIWMERPKHGSASCKFEICGVTKNVTLRERIAASMRDHLEKHGLPSGVVPSTGSTVVRCPLSVLCIQESTDDSAANADLCIGEIAKIVTFGRFLDSALENWHV